MRPVPRSSRAAALVAVALLWPSHTAAAREWVRVETPNFIVFGEPSERRLREVADEFERFREALARVVPGAATTIAAPTVVVVFNSQRTFAPYRPRYNGKPVSLGGFFLSTPHQNLVALTLENRERALRTIFHEYAHLVIANVARGVPVWLSEGLAEYYSTFSVQDDGRQAVVGGPILEHVLRLRQERLIPHEELLAVEASSPLYNEGERRNVFYAQSWALVHMLTAGQPDRSRELGRYVSLSAGGTPADQAWHQIFGSMKVNAELDRYVNRRRMQAFRFRFEQKIPRVDVAATIPSPGDVEAILADLLYQDEVREDAAARLQTSAAMEPGSALAKARLGLLRIGQERTDEAERLLFAAADNRGDWLVQYHVATGLMMLLQRFSGPADVARIAGAARRALEAVAAARPNLPNALALQATISVETDTDLDAGLEAIRKARTLAPGREDYAFEEARLLVELQEFGEARQVLSSLMTPRYHKEVRENARRLMAQVIRIEASGGAVRTGVRQLADGERRSEGLLERIECSSRGVVLHVRAGERTVRFQAPDLDTVEFISYRNDLKGPISCGPRLPPDPVYITWRPASGTAAGGSVVAVEFLSRDKGQKTRDKG